MISNNSSNQSFMHGVKKYVHDLPYDERKRLCYILDMNDCWKELGGRYLKLNRPELDRIGKAILRKQSPTDDLLSLMESHHCPVLTLFTWLYHMKHYQAMDVIKSFVDPKYHHLIPEGTGLEPEIFPRWKSENTNTTLVNQCNKENVKDNSVTTNDHSKHGSERTTERKLSEGSDIEKLDPSIPFIPFEELEKSTNYWDSTRKLGRGGFGVVYRGYWRQTDIAIKRLEPPRRNEAESNVPGIQTLQSLKELKHLNISRHDNILPLYGYSIHEQKYVLVYQFMPNGSLDDRLHRTNAEYLPWSYKHKVAKGTARGLQFLHGMDPPLVHGDIKSANILLDQYFDAKIGDFGLAREGPKAQYTHVYVSRVYGTRPYLPYEFLRSKKFSKKVDVYSFGVVLFEMATGKKPYEDGRSEKFLKDYVCNYEENLVSNLVDSRGKHENHIYMTLFKLFIDLGKKCVESDPKQRPEMINVFKTLDKYEKGPMNGSNTALNSVRRNSLIPPSCNTIPPTSISPLGSLDRRRSPSPTNQPAWNFPPSPIPTNQSPWNLSPCPSPTNQPLWNPPLMQVAEVSSCDKVSSGGNVHIQSNAAAEQNAPPIPDIKLIPPNESHTDLNIPTSDPSISGSVSESDSSTHYTDNSDGSMTSEIGSEDKIENKESVFDVDLPNLTIFQNSSEESTKSVDIGNVSEK